MIVGRSMPKHAQVVIIGGGCVGTSIAYHLARSGVRDVVILERFQLTAGSTWHAAGVIGTFKSSRTLTNLLKHSVELYRNLEAETGLSTGFAAKGSIRLAASPVRELELRRSADLAHAYGIELELISAAEASMLFPGADLSDVTCASYVPGDCVVNPTDLTQSMIKGARQKGVQLFEGVTVTRLDRDSAGRIAAVETDVGRITCETAVIAGGVWSRALAASVGVALPILPSYHQYFVTETMKDVRRDAPFLRDPDNYAYAKEEVGGLVLGVYETAPTLLENPLSPIHEPFRLGKDNWELIEAYGDRLTKRFPALAETGIRMVYNGIESFTADGVPIIGPALDVPGLYVATGCNANGIALAGGIGDALAHWITTGQSPLDMRSLSLDRFASFANNDQQVVARGLEGQGRHYAPSIPHIPTKAGRPWQSSPFDKVFAARGAVFEEVDYWEQAIDLPSNGADSRNLGVTIFDRTAACRFSVTDFDESCLATLQNGQTLAIRDGSIAAPIDLWSVKDRSALISAPANCEPMVKRWLSSLGFAPNSVSSHWVELWLVGVGAQQMVQALMPLCAAKRKVQLGNLKGWALLADVKQAGSIAKHLDTAQLAGLDSLRRLMASNASPVWGLDYSNGDSVAAANIAAEQRCIIKLGLSDMALHGREPVQIDGVQSGFVKQVFKAEVGNQVEAVIYLTPSQYDRANGFVDIIIGGASHRSRVQRALNPAPIASPRSDTQIEPDTMKVMI